MKTPGMVLFLVVIAFTSNIAAAQDVAEPDSTSDREFLRRLQDAQLMDFPAELLDLDTAYEDSIVALHDSLGIDAFADAVERGRRHVQWGFGPGSELLDYNRSEGVVLTGRLWVRPFGPRGPSVSSEGGYAFSSEEWRHRSSIQLPLRRGRFDWILQAHYQDRVAPFGVNREFGNALRAFIGGSDERDYLRRRGAQGSLQVRDERWLLEFIYSAERLNSVRVNTDFSVFSTMERSMPSIDEGIDRLAGLRWTWHGRKNSRVGASLAHFIAGGALGGDFDYQRSEAQLRIRQYVGREEFVFFGRGVHTGGAVPRQSRADIGGLGSVRGYDPRFAVGQSAIDLHLEMRLSEDLLRAGRLPGLEKLGIQFVPWIDAARVFDGDRTAWLTSAGLGLQRLLGAFDRASFLRLDLAVPFGPDRMDDLRLALRFAPMF